MSFVIVIYFKYRSFEEEFFRRRDEGGHAIEPHTRHRSSAVLLIGWLMS
jgi:hypothetical protein